MSTLIFHRTLCNILHVSFWHDVIVFIIKMDVLHFCSNFVKMWQSNQKMKTCLSFSICLKISSTLHFRCHCMICLFTQNPFKMVQMFWYSKYINTYCREEYLLVTMHWRLALHHHLSLCDRRPTRLHFCFKYSCRFWRGAYRFIIWTPSMMNMGF